MEMEKTISVSPSRTRTIVYRVTTIITVVGLILGGLTQVLHLDYQQKLFTQLGYPLYLLSIIGSAKMLGGIVLLLPRMPLLKVSAYSGAFFVMVSAVISHLSIGDAVGAINPLVVAGIVVTSCLLNPNIVFASPQK